MKNKTKIRTIKIPSELSLKLEEVAKIEDRSESSVIRNALRFFFENYGATKKTLKVKQVGNKL